MRYLFNNLAKYAMLRSIIYIILGVLMLLVPQAIMSIIVYILAAYVIILGAISILNYLRHRSTGVMGYDLVVGILMVVLGILMLFFTKTILSILPVFLGILLIIGGAANLGQTINYGRVSGGANVLLIILNILIIVGGIVVIINPFSSAVLLFQIFGGVTVALGIGELISFFTYRKVSKTMPDSDGK